MQNNAQVPSYPANVAAYPQLCGSWSGDEWPEDDLMEPQGNFAEICSGLHVEYGGESGSEKSLRNYGRVE